jgi:hypothetical protein
MSDMGKFRVLPVGAMMLLGLSACGGGGGSSMTSGTPTVAGQSCTSSTCGSALMTLTDAAGVFLSYKVKLVSLELKQADGTLVETLPAQTTVDFAQLVNLSEILSARQIPRGNYVSAQVTVDFTGASIMVDDGTGAAVAVSPVDGTGAALTTLQLSVQLDKQHALAISAGKSSRLAFDFNLLASNTVDLTKKTVTVSPVLVASVVPPDHKDLRVRGTLVSTDAANSDYTVQVQPFHEKSNGSQSPVVVHTTDTTTFEINGTPITGSAGLKQLATLPTDTMTVAFGALSSVDQSFTANRVLAGSSVEDGGLDRLSGDVVARKGNTLTLHAAILDDKEGTEEFQAKDSTVTIAEATGVTVEGQTSATPVHTIAEVSVGSHIEAFGAVTKDASGNATLDASAGRVRLAFTRIAGSLSDIGTGQVTLKLSTIDRLPVTLFDFSGTGTGTGTGTTNSSNSDPAKYLVSTGNLPLTGFSVDNPAQSIGFIAPFGAAPPDFIAVTLANGQSQTGPGAQGSGLGEDDSAQAKLEIDWGTAGATLPFKTLDAAHLDLDIANSSIGKRHTIEQEPMEIDLKSLASDPSIVPDAAATTTLFAIAHQQSKSIDNFNAFADFETKLAADLNGTVAALGMFAEGSYDAASNTFTARHLVVLLND